MSGTEHEVTEANATYDPELFSDEYKMSAVMAYPHITGISREALWTSSLAQREEAFGRILAVPQLRRLHDEYLRLYGPRSSLPEDNLLGG